MEQEANNVQYRIEQIHSILTANNNEINYRENIH